MPIDAMSSCLPTMPEASLLEGTGTPRAGCQPGGREERRITPEKPSISPVALLWPYSIL